MKMDGEGAERDDKRNVRFYQDRLIEHGLGVSALNWGSRESQQNRFEVLAAIAPLQGTKILDVGCGLGDFALWLRATEIDVDYTGIDLTAEMVDAAAINVAGASFRHSTVFEELERPSRYDYVFASGLFYLRENEPFEYLKATVSAMYALSRRGIAFNTLSTWADRIRPGDFHADPAETLLFCRTLSERVVLRHDYRGGDFTIYLHQTQ